MNSMGANGLGGGLFRMNGVRYIHWRCSTMVTRSIRREDAIEGKYVEVWTIDRKWTYMERRPSGTSLCHSKSLPTWEFQRPTLDGVSYDGERETGSDGTHQEVVYRWA